MVPTSQINGDQQTLTPRNSLSKQTTTLDPTTLMSAVEMMPIMTNPITSLKPFTKARIISKPFTSTSTSASASASTTTVKSITKDKNQTKPKFDLKESLKRPLSYKPHTGKFIFSLEIVYMMHVFFLIRSIKTVQIAIGTHVICLNFVNKDGKVFIILVSKFYSKVSIVLIISGKLSNIKQGGQCSSSTSRRGGNGS